MGYPVDEQDPRGRAYAGELDDELELRDYLDVLRRRWRWVAAVVVVVVGLSAAWTFTRTPRYAAETELLLDFSAPLVQESTAVRLDNARQVENELRFLRSTQVLGELEARLGYEPDASARGTGDSDTVVLRVTDVDADSVAPAADAYAQVYVELRNKRNAEKFLGTGEQIQIFIDDLDASIADLDPNEPSQAIDRDALIRQKTYYQEQLDAVRLSANVTEGVTTAVIITTAETPAVPYEPNPSRSLALALVAGSVLGVMAAFGREHLDTAIKTKDDLAEATGGLANLAVVPHFPQQAGIAPVALSGGVGSEAYRTLRVSVQFAGLGRNLRAVQITSSQSGEGKTTTAANLAVVLAQSGTPVALVDCDLRNPSIHGVFGLRNSLGFTDVLVGDIELWQALQPVSGVSDLVVLSAGTSPPNPTELLSADRMANMARSAGEVFAELSASGYLVIADSPPVLPVADSLALSGVVDGTVFVARASVVAKDDITSATGLLANVGARLVGTVLNDQTTTDGRYGYGYGYGATPPRPKGLRRVVPRRSRRRGQHPAPAAPVVVQHAPAAAPPPTRSRFEQYAAAAPVPAPPRSDDSIDAALYERVFGTSPGERAEPAIDLAEPAVTHRINWRTPVADGESRDGITNGHHDQD